MTIFATHVPGWMKDFIFLRDGYSCRYCGWYDDSRSGAGLEADHVWPRSRGGLTDALNLVTACTGCNREKGDRTSYEYVLYRRAFPLLSNWGPTTPFT